MVERYLLLGALFLFVFGCTGMSGKDAIAVWEHQSDTWDVYYSVYDLDSDSWQSASAIAADPGDDHDPDVSSTDSEAIAVWNKQTGGSSIYYSYWDGNWTAPEKISDDDQDTDPTVAMDGSGNALAAWVNKGIYLYSSYYTKGSGWSDPERLNTTGLAKASMPELAYSEGNYYLVFTGQSSSGVNAYLSVYSGSWGAPIVLGDDAVLDNKIPTDQRTGIDASGKKVTAVWPGKSNSYYATLGGDSRIIAQGKMPDVALDSVRNDNFVYTSEDLFHMLSGNTLTVSGMLSDDDRPSVTFIRNNIGLVLWWTKVTPESQIYYSYFNGFWQGVSLVDESLEGTSNRNPAVSPLEKRSDVSIPPFCGDGTINLPFEQCEIGVPCAIGICNVANCQCVGEIPPPDKKLDCSVNTQAGIIGINLFGPGMICQDDCKAVYGNDYTCDATCSCIKQKPKQLSCAGNSGIFGPAVSPAPGVLCADDCALLGPEYQCDVKTCSCQKNNPPPLRNISCSQNSWDSLFGSSNYAKGQLCVDDCEELGENVECNPTTCVCELKDDTKVYCAANTRNVAATDKNDFDSSVNICEDNCERLGAGYECNIGSCTCTKPYRENVSCASSTWNALISSTNVTPFDPSTQLCQDDCAETFGTEGVRCNPQSCRCELVPNCADNTEDTVYNGKNSFKGGQCYDNCKEFGPGLACDPQTCLCKKEAGEEVYCAANTDDGYVSDALNSTSTRFDPSIQICRDNCKEIYGEDTQCDPQTCYCIPKEDIKELSCSVNTDSVTVTDINKFNPSATQCRDDCAKYYGSDYECSSSCTCTKKPKEAVTCYGNTISSYDFFGNSKEFNPSTMQCQDNCKEKGQGLGIDLVCNAESCICEPVLKCAGNTLDSIDGNGAGSLVSLYRCEDNCDKLGPGYVCDAQSCVCRKAPGEKVYCAANTDDAYLNDGLGTTHERFDSTKQCIDNCEEIYGKEAQCDPGTCFCIPKEDLKELSCSLNTDSVEVTDVNKFNPQTTQCKDDCAEYYGSDYTCSASCTCVKDERPTCSSNTIVGNVGDINVSIGTQCRDDCAEVYGEGYSCDPQLCYCKSNKTFTPRCGDGYVSTEFVPGGGAEECDPAATPTGCYPSMVCNAECQCESEEQIVECGDGQITGGEQCDWGSVDTNKCDAGYYCSGCECKPLETSPRCGDGKISVEAGEQCDPGSVYYNKCPIGQFCELCKCVGAEEINQCGDGRVVPPEECDHGNSFTEKCPSGLQCSSCQCVDPDDIEEPVCGNNQREAGEECDGTDDNACSSSESCQSCSCVEDSQPFCGNNEREGSEECDGRDDSACLSGEVCNSSCVCQVATQQTHTECDIAHNQCITVEGPGTSQCSNDGDCTPPEVDCQAFCSGEGFSQSLGSGFSSAQACSAEASEEAVQCTTKCVYTKFGSWSNQAGTTTCCCKEVKSFACSDCPGQNPECPDPDVVCPANQP